MTPTFWAFICGMLVGAFVLNVLSHNRFDPGMNYSNFLQNWVQLLALAVTSVATVTLANRHDDLHDKVDAIARQDVRVTPQG